MRRAWRAVTEGVLLLLVPGVLLLCTLLQWEQTALLSMLAVIAAVVPFFWQFERKKPRPRDIMPVVVLAAVAAAGRVLFTPIPQVKPVSAIVIIAGICLGRQSGFMTGALAALASNMFFGQGPWTPWQMYAWGLIGYLAGILEERGAFHRPWAVYTYGFLSGLLYGFILDSWYIVGFISPVTWPSALAGYAAGLPFSLLHAAATVVFLLPLFQPWKRKIGRIQQKFGLLHGIDSQMDTAKVNTDI